MSSQPNSVRAIFDQVVDLPPTERAAALGRLCADNPALRAEVEALLASHDAAHAGNFMSSPTAATTVRNAAITETAGSRLGPYKLLQIIGEGGFGTVFLAEQSEPVRRRVALKIIKLGMDTKQVIARFEAERQALALMDHPHIARVLDAGSTPITEHGGGRPYFVMEYVVGDAITQFAANNNLDLRARLELFAQVCSAVQHAHTKGIIHRDIKPGNVLVTMTDGKPFARVIDFGIAKATSSVGHLTDKTLFTEHRQLIGTPEYMSPEQAQGSPDIDTRTDVYALGVLLYELLAGDTPFDGKRLRSAAWDEMRRIIKEEDPPTPSARVTQRMKSGGSSSSSASPSPTPSLRHSVTPSLSSPLRHSVTPSLPPSLLRGELDWIVMKSLDKDRARRYETPSALASDIERHLKREAVQAAPPSAAYRLRKFVRRNKGPVIAGSAVAAALLLGIAGTTAGLYAAQYNARAATNNAQVARAARDALADANTVLANQIDTAKDALRNVIIETVELDPEERGAVMRSEKVTEEEARKMQADAYVEGIRGARQFMAEEKGETVGDQTEIDILALVSLWKARELNESREHLRQQTDAAEWSAYTANLALAQAAMDAGNWPEARDRLAQCPESKRGWEWRFADLLSQLTIMHTALCNQGLTSPDGTQIAFWSSGGYGVRNQIYVRSIDNPRDVVTLQWLGNSEVIRTIEWSPDGKQLLATSGDDICHIFSADGSGAARTLKAGERCARAAAWSSDGSHILTLSASGEIRVWDTRESNEPRILKAGVQSAAWSPDGSRIAGAMPDGSIVLLNADGSEETTIHHHDQVGHWSLAWSPDGERLVTYSNLNDDSRVFVIRADGAEEPLIMNAGRGATQDAAWSPDGTSLLIGFRYGPAAIMRIATPREPLMLSGHPDGVSSVSWSRDGARAFTSSWDGICVWDAATGSLIGRAITEPSDDSWAMSSAPGSTLVASNYSAYHFGSYEPTARLIALNAWGGPDQRLHEQLWELPLSLYVDALMSSIPEAPITGRAVTTPDGSRRIEADGRVVRFIDVHANRELAVLRTSAQITDLTLTGDGTRLILHHADLPARVWDIRDPEERRAEMANAWAERAPAGAYIDTLLAGPTPTDALMDVVISDASLTPLRRLVAAEVLLEHLNDIDRIAYTTFESIMRDAEKATDAWKMVDTKAIKAHITAAAAALEPSDNLPPRAIEKVIAQARDWEYRPSEPSAEERLAEQARQQQLNEASRVSAAAEMQRAVAPDAIRTALQTQIDLLGITDPAVALTLSRFPAFCYTYGLSFSHEDLPLATRIADAFRQDSRSTNADKARAFAGAAAIAVDAGDFVHAAQWFEWFDTIPATDREGTPAYISVYLNTPNGDWRGEKTPTSIERRAIAEYRSVLAAAMHDLRNGARPFRIAHIIELVTWLESISAYREPFAMPLVAISAMAHWQLALAKESIDEFPIPEESDRERHREAARSALSRARAIMADPSALDDSGRPWSENPDAQVLLKEAEDLIGNAAE